MSVRKNPLRKASFGLDSKEEDITFNLLEAQYYEKVDTTEELPEAQVVGLSLREGRVGRKHLRVKEGRGVDVIPVVVTDTSALKAELEEDDNLENCVAVALLGRIPLLVKGHHNTHGPTVVVSSKKGSRKGRTRRKLEDLKPTDRIIGITAPDINVVDELTKSRYTLKKERKDAVLCMVMVSYKQYFLQGSRFKIFSSKTTEMRAPMEGQVKNSPQVTKARPCLVSIGGDELKPQRSSSGSGYHNFKLSFFHRPSWCNLCGKFIYGQQGQRCKVCDYRVHKRCYPPVKGNECSAVLKETNKKVNTTGKGTIHEQFDNKMRKLVKELQPCEYPSVPSGKAHTFDAVRFSRLTWCQACNDFIPINNSEGFSCQICNYAIHKRCESLAQDSCSQDLQSLHIWENSIAHTMFVKDVKKSKQEERSMNKFINSILKCRGALAPSKARSITNQELQWLIEAAGSPSAPNTPTNSSNHFLEDNASSGEESDDSNTSESEVRQATRLAACVALASCAFPVEHVPGARKKILACGLLETFLKYASEGLLKVHHEIDPSQVETGAMIAQGAVGKVFRGKYLNNDCALKMFAGSLSFDPNEFRRELALMCMLENEHLLPCYGACTVGITKPGEPIFIATEFMAMGTLKEILRANKEFMDLEMNLKMARDICRGMKWLHSLKLIHRDLKSSNLLINKDMKCKIIDFGTSRVVDNVKNMTGNLGTPAWIAPEVLNNNKYSEKADVYSFSIVMWEIMTCKSPYSEMKSWDVVRTVLEGARPPIPEDANKEYTAIMRLCWDPEPDKRPTFAQLDVMFTKIIDNLAASESASHRLLDA